MTTNETRWEIFVDEVASSGIVWTIEKNGEYVTSPNRHGTKCFPWWSSKERVLSQLKNVPAYKDYQQIGFEWAVFINEWVPSLKEAKCLLGINYAKNQMYGLIFLLMR